jgi:hypothetical protein
MKKTALISILLLAGAQAWASGSMKPGLWEMTVKSDAMKNMPKIPPEQMEQMRRMGISVPQFQDGGMVTKVCVTPEMAQKETPGTESMEADCQTRNVKKTANGYQADIVCDGAMKGQGKVVGSYSGGEAFSSTFDFKGTMHGQPVSQRQETSGRWLSSNCGAVKALGK